MRILAISHLYPHNANRRYGIFVARQLQAMEKAGADITVIVPRARIPSWSQRNRTIDDALVECLGIHTIPIPYTGLPGKWFWRWSGLSAFRAIRNVAQNLHAKNPFDIIYSTQLILGGDAGRRLAKTLNIPSANLAIGSDVNVIARQSTSMQKHYLRVLQDLHGTLTCGQSLKDEIQRHRPHPPFPETLCVYGVVDLDDFVPVTNRSQCRSDLRLPSDEFIMLFAGHLVLEKGLLELIQAFNRLAPGSRRARLLILGTGGNEHAIKQAAKQSPAKDAIQFVGTVEPDRVKEYMQASDLFLLPSYTEGMPNAVMEAMACGLPVVCTDVGGLKASLSTSQGAKLVAARQVQPLVAAIEEIMSNAKLRSRMSLAARETAEQQFGVRRSARRILDYLSSIISDASSSSR